MLDPPPRIFRDIKLGGGTTSDVNVSSIDFNLKGQVEELLELLKAVRDGEISQIEVRGGIPFKAVVSENPWGVEGEAW